MVSDAVSSPRRVKPQGDTVMCSQGCAGVVAKKLIAQSTDKAHGDGFGHVMRVLASGRQSGVAPLPR